ASFLRTFFASSRRSSSVKDRSRLASRLYFFSSAVALHNSRMFLRPYSVLRPLSWPILSMSQSFLGRSVLFRSLLGSPIQSLLFRGLARRGLPGRRRGGRGLPACRWCRRGTRCRCSRLRARGRSSLRGDYRLAEYADGHAGPSGVAGLLATDFLA